MPRKSAAALAIARVTPITDARPAPPDDLTEAQGAEWRRIVDRLPADWFPAECRPLLAALCRHIVQARAIADLINQFQPAWVAEEGGLERLDLLQKMLDREDRATITLSTKLRLTPQSRYAAQKVNTLAKNARSADFRVPWEISTRMIVTAKVTGLPELLREPQRLSEAAQGARGAQPEHGWSSAAWPRLARRRAPRLRSGAATAAVVFIN